MSKGLCREENETEIWKSVQTLSERRKSRVYFEQKAELPVQGECTVQKRLSEAEAEMDIRYWEQRNADTALHETCRELESLRLELYQANQRADQAQREKINLCGECVGEVVVSRPHLLGESAHGILLLNLGKLKGSGKCRKVKVMKKRRKRSRESGRTTTQHVMTMEMTMRRKHYDLSLEPVCDVQEMSVTTQN